LENNIKMSLREMGYEVSDRTELSQDSVQLRAFGKTLMKLGDDRSG